MNIIIPVGGLGTRLRPQTWSRPKPLVSVAGKPVLGHVLDTLSAVEIDRAVFITGFLGEQIEEYVRDNYHFDAAFVKQHQPLGQSHAILQAREQVSGPSLIVFPDMVFEAPLDRLATLEADGAIFVKEVDDPRRFGIVMLDNGRATRLIEKPQAPENNLAIMGVYFVRDVQWLFQAIDRQMAEGIQTKGEYYLADAVQLMIDDGALFTTLPATVWEDCGTPDALLQTNRFLLARSETCPSATDSVVIPPVFIADSARVSGSVIGPDVSIGDNVVVENAIVRDSIVDAGATIESAMLTRSIVGRDAIVRGEPFVLVEGTVQRE
ncbi:MAG TPA: sugar phosphate nucleotidyltransferase, partial [Thermomicrobiales bacterium]|nr:sugar phosphate nucleotidyltransferase [Thermomicrobiales bacterium]